MCKL